MPLAAIWRLIRTLLVVLGAPACMIARVWRRDERHMRRFHRWLLWMRARGRSLRYEGEDDATVAKRIERLNWLARDPLKALRHMVRRGGGHMRWLFGTMFAPASWMPPLLWQAPLPVIEMTCAAADTS